MHLVPVIILLLVAVAVFGRYAGRARGVPGTRPARPGRGAGSPRGRTGVLRLPSPGRGTAPARAAGTGFLGHRRAMAAEKLRHRHAVIRDDLKHRRSLVSQWAAHTIRMKERQAQWDREDAVKTAPPPAAPQAGAGDANPGGSRPAAAPPPATVPGSVVPGDAPQQPSTPQQPGGTPVTTSTSAAEQAIEGMQAIHASALAGNIRSKQGAIQACAEVQSRAAALMTMLARELSELRYGPEITEPLEQAARLAQACGLQLGDADSAISSLASMSVGDLADSPRQAPERTELSETGSR